MNRLNRLKPREQLLAAIVMVVLLLGAYGLLRFIPANQAIKQIKQQTVATQLRISQMDIPDEADEEIDEILEQLDEQEQAQAQLREDFALIESRLAPFNSQELRLRISTLAPSLGVRIRENQVFRIQAAPAQPTTQTSSRRRATADSEPQTDRIVPATATWIQRVSPGSLFHRPLQRYQLEGDFDAIRRFIHALDDLPWQVTVVRLDIQRLPSTPLRGQAQLLTADLVLAL